MTAGQMQEKLDLIEYTLDYDEFGRRGHCHRGRARGDEGQAAGLSRSWTGLHARHDLRLQHLGAVHHRDGPGDRQAAQGHRHALFQPGARDEAGRDHPRRRDRRGHGRHRRAVHPGAAQDPGHRPGVPRLPGEPPADALPERGGAGPGGGRGHAAQRSTKPWAATALAGRWGPFPDGHAGHRRLRPRGRVPLHHYGERVASQAKLFDKLVEAKRLGEKTGAGFYTIPPPRPSRWRTLSSAC
jgi:hypothetical protein